MKLSLWRTALLVFSLTLAACGGGGGSSPPPAEPIGQVVTFSLKAASNGFSYPIQVYLPQSYATGTTTLPAIYATEGDAPYGSPSGSRFDAFKGAMQRRGTQAILVGIGGTARRDADFLLPGAAQYLDFITKELAPEIERRYRADPKKRALSGLSHGGYFVVAALVMEGRAGTFSFSHYLSTESSYGFNANPAAFLAYEADQLDTGGAKPLPVTLLLAGAKTSNGPVVVNPLYAQMAAHAHPGLTLIKTEYDTTHVGADLPAFEDALTRFLQ